MEFVWAKTTILRNEDGILWASEGAFILQSQDGGMSWRKDGKLAQSSRFGVGGVAFRTGKRKGCYVDTVAFGAYRRKVFDCIGGFDEELIRNQDDEFNFRLKQAGGKIWLDPSIRCVYYSRASFGKLWRQYFQYGLYKVRLIQKRGAVPSVRHLIPGGFVLGLLASLALALGMGQPIFALTVAGPYVLACIMASLWTSRKAWHTLPVLPLAFSTLHIYHTGWVLSWDYGDGDKAGGLPHSGSRRPRE